MSRGYYLIFMLGTLSEQNPNEDLERVKSDFYKSVRLISKNNGIPNERVEGITNIACNIRITFTATYKSNLSLPAKLVGSTQTVYYYYLDGGIVTGVTNLICTKKRQSVVPEDVKKYYINNQSLYKQVEMQELAGFCKGGQNLFADVARIATNTGFDYIVLNVAADHISQQDQFDLKQHYKNMAATLGIEVRECGGTLYFLLHR